MTPGPATKEWNNQPATEEQMEAIKKMDTSSEQSEKEASKESERQAAG